MCLMKKAHTSFEELRVSFTHIKSFIVVGKSLQPFVNMSNFCVMQYKKRIKQEDIHSLIVSVKIY